MARLTITKDTKFKDIDLFYNFGEGNISILSSVLYDLDVSDLFKDLKNTSNYTIIKEL